MMVRLKIDELWRNPNTKGNFTPPPHTQIARELKYHISYPTQLLAVHLLQPSKAKPSQAKMSRPSIHNIILITLLKKIKHLCYSFLKLLPFEARTEIWLPLLHLRPPPLLLLLLQLCTTIFSVYHIATVQLW